MIDLGSWQYPANKYLIVAVMLLSIMGILLLITGFITLLGGFIMLTGVDILSLVLPKAIKALLLPGDINFIALLGITGGMSLIIISRLFHTSSKWLKQNERKGAILATLISAFSLIFLSILVTVMNLTVIGYVVYFAILLYAAIMLSVVFSWMDMNGGIDQVFPSVGYFFMSAFIIIILFSLMYTMFPKQSTSLLSVGSASFFSVFSNNTGTDNFYSSGLNYSYPNSLININLGSLASSIGSLLSLNRTYSVTNENISSILNNATINLLLPSSFISSVVGNFPGFATKLGSLNITDYRRENSSVDARRYLEAYFQPLTQLYLVMTGSQKVNFSGNVTFFKLSPNKLQSYLKLLNVSNVNSSFPINITKYAFSNETENKTYGQYLPSQLLLVNMSNHVGIQLTYDQSKVFNLTRVPFSSFSLSFYVQNSTLCFEFGAVFPERMQNYFYESFSRIQKTLSCG